MDNYKASLLEASMGHPLKCREGKLVGLGSATEPTLWLCRRLNATAGDAETTESTNAGERTHRNHRTERHAMGPDVGMSRTVRVGDATRTLFSPDLTHAMPHKLRR